jgi:hypothetical protein
MNQNPGTISRIRFALRGLSDHSNVDNVPFRRIRTTGRKNRLLRFGPHTEMIRRRLNDLAIIRTTLASKAQGIVSHKS